MIDPFVKFMDLYAPSCGLDEAFRSWLIKNEEHCAPYVVPDFAPFRDTSGKFIDGRVAWREHLRSTGTQELGRGELMLQTERHQQAKENYRQRMVIATRESQPQAIPQEAFQTEPSRTTRRVMERLQGRPMPDRPTLIKIAMEERLRK